MSIRRGPLGFFSLAVRPRCLEADELKIGGATQSELIYSTRKTHTMIVQDFDCEAQSHKHVYNIISIHICP